MNTMNKLTADDKRIIVAGVLEALGREWSDDSNDEYPSHRLVHASGYGVWLGWDDWKTRIDIHGRWPKTSDGREAAPYGCAPTISVSATRAPAAIAREITKRFLPMYLPLYDKQQDVVNGQNAYEAQTAASNAALLTLPGIEKSTYSSGVRVVGYAPHTISAQGDSVRFEAFNVPLDVALKVLPLLRREA